MLHTLQVNTGDNTTVAIDGRKFVLILNTCEKQWPREVL